MGQASSKNTVENITNSLVGVTNDVVQECFVRVDPLQGQTLEATGRGSVIEGATINMKQSATLNVDCVLRSDITNKISNALDEKVKQEASAQNAALGFTGTRAENLTKSIANLATQIKTAYTGKCGGDLSATQLQTTKASDGAVIRNIVINMDQTLAGNAKCILENKSVSEAKAEVQRIVDQSAKTKVSWLTIGGVIIIIVIVIAIIIGVIIFIRAKQKTTSQALNVLTGAPASGGAPPGPPGSPAAPKAGGIGGLASSLGPVAAMVPIPQVKAAGIAATVAGGALSKRQ